MSGKPPRLKPEEHVGMIKSALANGRLCWALFWDSRVAWFLKLLVLLAFIYPLTPFNVIPEFVVGLGQLDDLGVILLACALLIEFAPADVVEMYRQRIANPSAPQTAATEESVAPATARPVNTGRRVLFIGGCLLALLTICVMSVVGPLAGLTIIANIASAPSGTQAAVVLPTATLIPTVTPTPTGMCLKLKGTKVPGGSAVWYLTKGKFEKMPTSLTFGLFGDSTVTEVELDGRCQTSWVSNVDGTVYWYQPVTGTPTPTPTQTPMRRP